MPDTDAAPLSATTALQDLESVAFEIADRWDKDQRSGKLLAALEGRLSGYSPKVSRIRRTLENAARLSPPSTPAQALGSVTDPDVLPPWPVQTCLDAMQAEIDRMGPTSLYAGLAAHVQALLRKHVLTEKEGAEA